MNLDKLKGQVPDTVLSQIPDVMTKFEINTTLRLAHFLSQCAHESGGFKSTSENLKYSAKRLLEVFPKYFKQPGLAEAYAGKPELIGSRVYGGRMGNGDESTKDGYKFRGRGYIQLTGKSNYAAFDKFVNEDIVATPDLVATQYPLLSAAWFFHKNNINKISDRGATLEVVTAVTKAVNGGKHGLDDRNLRFKKYFTLLS
jgi:putative chitinase